jgi:hypothetical protein
MVPQKSFFHRSDNAVTARNEAVSSFRRGLHREERPRNDDHREIEERIYLVMYICFIDEKQNNDDSVKPK